MQRTPEMQRERFKVIISDCHMSAGRFFEGHLNPHEDFHADGELADLLEHFSTGQYGIDAHGPVEVELVINGDFFDFLGVPYQGEFIDVITEDISLYKTEAIIAGHPRVMAALRRFASFSGKTITYMMGNHDTDLMFDKVRERIIRELDPEGEFPGQKISVLHDRDRIELPEGVEIRHGNQFEQASMISYEKPFIDMYEGKPALNIPWGSFFVLKIVNRLKWERDYINKVRPLKAFILFGLVMDTRFSMKYCFLAAYYFFKTRLAMLPRLRSGFSAVKEFVVDAIRNEARIFMDLEKDARAILDAKKSVNTVVFGHSHRPMNRVYPDGKQYINTGTWVNMINLDWQGLGQQSGRTFALVTLDGGQAKCELRQWSGERGPHQVFQG